MHIHWMAMCEDKAMSNALGANEITCSHVRAQYMYLAISAYIFLLYIDS